MKIKITYTDLAKRKLKDSQKLKSEDTLYIKPTRAHWFDAGLDCYPVEDRCIWEGNTEKISLGFSLEIPHGYVGLLVGRSSLNAKGINVALGIIDSGYTGEICAVVTNNSDMSLYFVKHDQKICQLLLIPIQEIEPIDADEWDTQSLRKDGGFGSTNGKINS